MSLPANAVEHQDLRPIRQLRNTKEFYRFLIRKLQLPQSLSSAIVKGAKYAWNPAQTAVRERVANGVQVSAETQQLKKDGYLLFAPERFDGLSHVLDTCQTIFEQSGVADEDLSARKKRFLVTVIENESFLEWPEIFDFATSRQLIDIATGYFGRVPVLSNVSLWWTPPNESVEQSQMFHCDREDSSVLKLFFNTHKVTDEMGPFNLIGADASDKVKSAIGYAKRKSSRVSDEEISDQGAMSHRVSLEGPRCAGACVDTYRCLHYGSRANAKSRLVLMIRFSDCLAPYTDEPNWYESMRNRDVPLDEVQRLALGLQV
jgi:hypothetical protein